ncbi:hypothetical protein HYW42_02605 [Candidatus Daviesbacteria bacterium]|nr:hypothetical protein [Candidatus Daviesbacteria bacterium]
MKLANFFIPHKDTHKKAHLISWEALFFYVFIFILLQVGFSVLGYVKPGILGIESSINQQKIIELTNSERAKKGMPPVKENSALDQAAKLKAENMFSENYWAHFAPSGKTPWDFIIGSGYKFTFAGENLAKNFYTSDDVVVAWMNSSTHRDNLLNSKYEDIGIAVVEGVLNGQKTTLIVQMFGTTNVVSPTAVVNVGNGDKISVKAEEFSSKPQLVASAQSPKIIPQVLIDPYQVSKGLGLGLLAVIGTLLTIDLIILRKRGVFRLASHHVAHMALMSVTAATILSGHIGEIL